MLKINWRPQWGHLILWKVCMGPCSRYKICSLLLVLLTEFSLDWEFMFDVIFGPRKHRWLDVCSSKNQILICCSSTRYRNCMFLLTTLNFIYLFNLILLFIILVWVFATWEVDSANWRRDNQTCRILCNIYSWICEKCAFDLMNWLEFNPVTIL